MYHNYFKNTVWRIQYISRKCYFLSLSNKQTITSAPSARPSWPAASPCSSRPLRSSARPIWREPGTASESRRFARASSSGGSASGRASCRTPSTCPSTAAEEGEAGTYPGKALVCWQEEETNRSMERGRGGQRTQPSSWLLLLEQL